MSCNKENKFRNLMLLRMFIIGIIFLGSSLPTWRTFVEAQGTPIFSDERFPFPAQPSDKLSESTPPRLQQTPLDAIILFNPDRNRSVVLPGGWPLEVLDDFNRFLLQGQQESVVPFVIQNLSMQGRAVGGRVETTIRVVLTTMGNRTVRIPIGLKEGILPFPEMRPETGSETSPEIGAKTGDSTKKPTTGHTDENTFDERTGENVSLPVRYAGPGTFELLVDPEDGQYVLLLHLRRNKPAGEAKAGAEASTSVSNGVSQADITASETEKTGGSEISDEDGTDPAFPEANASIDSSQEDADMATGQDQPTINLQRHELTFSLWFPITRIGDDEQRLAISFPPTVSSQFVLTVPIADAVGNVTPGTLMDIVPTSDPKTTRFNLLGLKTNFDFSWRRQKTEPVEERPVLRVDDALIIARLENRTLHYEATLPIRSPTGSFERFRIRLPQGTILDQENTEKFAANGGYSYRMLPKEEWSAWSPPSNEGGEESPVLEFLLPRKTTGTVKVHLRAIRHLSDKPGDWRSFGGFEVVGAERQRGHLAVSIPTEMRAHWKPVRNIRRTELSPTLAQDGIDAVFEYFAQPFSLRCQIATPQTRINVKPEYQVQVNKGTMSLTANLSYFIHGSKTEKLGIQLFDWQWSGGDVRPTNLVDVEAVDQDESGLLTVPLRIPSEGEFDIELKAHRVLSPQELKEKRIIVRLPQPEADWIEPAAPFVVVPADNVEVVPIDRESVKAVFSDSSDMESQDSPISSESDDVGERLVSDSMNAVGSVSVQTSGLTRRTRRSIPLRIEIPTRQQEPLIYQTESAEAVFAADIQYHGLEIRTVIQADVRLLEPANQITEVITYDVAYEPIDRIFLSIPPALAKNDDIRVSLGGKLLEMQTVASAPEGDATENGVLKRISLPGTMIGRFQLVINYGVPEIQLDEDVVTTTTLPFITPDGTKAISQQANMILDKRGIRIELHDNIRDGWKEVGRNTAGYGTLYASGGMAFFNPTFRNRISLRVSLADRDVLGTTVVERAWLQTWLSDGVRVDRGTYQITSNRDSVSFWVPAALAKGRIVVKRDHLRIPARLSAKNELTIPIERKDKPTLIEIWYEIHDRFRHSMHLELPRFGEDALVRCEYWQIILPQNLHIIGIPEGWTPEYHWTWKDWFWGRVPATNMEEIGLGDSSLENAGISRANEYLFSSLHPPTHASFHTMQRSVIVLLSSSLSLLVGLALIYFPRTRYAGSLLGLAVALIGMIVYQPAPVLLMLQASTFGVVLALIANYVYRIVYREDKWIMPLPSGRNESSPQQVYSVIMDEDSQEEPPQPDTSTAKLSPAISPSNQIPESNQDRHPDSG